MIIDARSYIRRALGSLGYKAGQVCVDYSFAAIDQPRTPIYTATVAAFFEVPPSYRNAAIALVEVNSDTSVEKQLADRRALGAPYLIAVGSGEVSAWAMNSRGFAKIDSAPIGDLEEFFERHSESWRPASIRRLKALPARPSASRQGVLFDPIALYTIQAQVHEALDTLLRQFLTFFQVKSKAQLALERDYKLLFPLIFRLLTGKILHDRGALSAAVTTPSDAKQVIEHVAGHYSLQPLPLTWTSSIHAQLDQAWHFLRSGLYVRNIAADDLAFVYENTLITPQTRRALGTHSTPPPVAEYVLRSFALEKAQDLQDLRVFEPFAGSCVFLTAAMRRFKELLPSEWSPAQMHKHLVSHFSASEIDGFAAELARLSLILADYPNPNGWRIQQEDLFNNGVLEARAAASNVIVCNPPFEVLERIDGGASLPGSTNKPLRALQVFLQAKPRFLGIVMPPGFTSHNKYLAIVEDLVRAYEDVEFLDLPEGTFRHASVGATVAIAQSPRIAATSVTKLARASVFRADLQQFARTLEPSTLETTAIDPTKAPGVVGLQPLRDVWEYLAGHPRLDGVVDIHRGLEWTIPQGQASTTQPKRGSRKGVHRLAESLAQFRILKAVYLDCTEEHARGGALGLPWNAPKVICSAVRMSRGPWRVAACTDYQGLVASQQFFGMWPRNPGVSLEAVSAILNSPLANAFSEVHDPSKRLRVDRMKNLPIPDAEFGQELEGLIQRYRAAVSEGPLLGSGKYETAVDVLLAIDAAILARYDLPPRLEKALLKHMSQGARPCHHPFGPYPGVHRPGALPLGAQILAASRATHRPRWEEALKPLPEDIGDVFEVV